jgi:hypothetical protein
MGGALAADDNWRHASWCTNYTRTRAHAWMADHINMDWSPSFQCNRHWTRYVCLKAMGKLGCLHALSQAGDQAQWCEVTYLLMYGAEPFLRSCQMCSHSGNSQEILRNPKVHHRIHKTPPLVPILSQFDSVHPIPSYISKIHFILSTHLRLGLPSGLFHSGLSLCLIN